MKNLLFALDFEVNGQLVPGTVLAREIRREFAFDVQGVPYRGESLRVDDETTFRAFYGGLEITQTPLGQALVAWMRSQ